MAHQRFSPLKIYTKKCYIYVYMPKIAPTLQHYTHSSPQFHPTGDEGSVKQLSG